MAHDEKLTLPTSSDLIDAKSSVGPLPGPTRQESSDDHPAIVAILDSKTRVIESSDSIQWIIQKRKGRGWRSTYYCRTKAGLLLYVRPVAPGLLAFPDYFSPLAQAVPMKDRFAKNNARQHMRRFGAESVDGGMPQELQPPPRRELSKAELRAMAEEAFRITARLPVPQIIPPRRRP
jgi:hypothetical protein